MYALKIIIGMAVGGLLGYFWHRIVGCASGMCPIVRNPYLSTIFGVFIGLLLTLNK